MKTRAAIAREAKEHREADRSWDEEESSAVFMRERIIIGSLFCGYFGREFCTMHLFTTSKLWQLDSGVDDHAYSDMLAAGNVVGAFGKILFGVLADSLLSGKSVLLIATLGSAGLTIAFGLVHSHMEYLVIWLVMHIFIPGCWVGLVSIVAENVAAKRHGKTIAFISLAFVGGDAVVRAIYGVLLQLGMGWRGICIFGSVVASISTSPIFAFIPGSSTRIASADKVAEPVHPDGQWATPKRLLKSTAFALVCLLSLMLRSVRSFFMSFTVPFLVEVFCRSTLSASSLSPTEADIKQCLTSSEANSRAVLGSVLFPLTGIFSTIICGILKDILGQRSRALIPITFLSLSLASLAQLSLLGADSPWLVALASLVVCGFGLFGPYTLLAGAFAIDVGGEEGAATASGLIDAAGTLGGVLIITLKGRLGSDWSSIFSVLFCAVGIAVLLSVRLLLLDRDNHRAASRQAAMHSMTHFHDVQHDKHHDKPS